MPKPKPRRKLRRPHPFMADRPAGLNNVLAHLSWERPQIIFSGTKSLSPSRARLLAKWLLRAAEYQDQIHRPFRNHPHP